MNDGLGAVGVDLMTKHLLVFEKARRGQGRSLRVNVSNSWHLCRSKVRSTGLSKIFT